MDLRLLIHYHKSYIGIFKDIGITESEKVVKVQRSDFIGEHIEGAASKTAKIIKKAERGVSFVDGHTPYPPPPSAILGRSA